VIPAHVTRKAIAALSAMASALMDRPDALDAVVHQLSPQAGLDTTLALRAARQLEAELQQALARDAAVAA
jgi:hypothetical protein